jgi:hypothetical protein
LKLLIHMRINSKSFIPALVCIGLMLCITPVFAQVKTPTSPRFNKDLADANLSFTLPAGFRETKPAGNDDSFDYAIEVPDGDFEIWFQAKSLKENRPVKLKNDKQVNPDSLYLEMGRAQAAAFVGENGKPIARNIPPYSLAHYGADAGKTYLVNLPDAVATKHYKYAMIVVLQKNHVGTLEAVCFANELGPSFFKSLSTAQNCIKFNQ